jgi:TonB family protein
VAILATIGGLHIGAFVLAVAGLGPRLDWLQPASPPFIYVQPKPPLSPPLAPLQTGRLAYILPRQPFPQVLIPDFKQERSPPPEGRSRMCVPRRWSRVTGGWRRSSTPAIRLHPGRASARTVAGSSGFARLDAAVTCVIRRLEFNPGRRDGAAVAASVTLPIVFRLH